VTHSIASRFSACCLLLGAFLAAVLTGCGSSGIAPVRGTVEYQGKPLEQGRVGFHPENGRPAFGDLKDGQFTLTTLEPGDGAVVGLHRVTVHSDEPSDPNDAFSDRISLIPDRYTKPDTSGLTAEVKPGGNNEFQFTLTD